MNVIFNKEYTILYITITKYMNYLKQLNGPNVVGITWEDNVTIRILTNKR